MASRHQPALRSSPPRRELQTAPNASPAVVSGAPPLGQEWQSLTDLGRHYGVSAVVIGKLLRNCGLRLSSGEPSPDALRAGLALCQQAGHHHQALWHRLYVGPYLEDQGLEPLKQSRLVGLWADLLQALQQGSPAIAMSAEEMAGEIPSELVSPVNQALRQRGSSFQVGPVRRGAGPRPLCSPSPAVDEGSPHRCD